ncbi:TetR/AcrR family transcriptional regulator [Mycolicibacterium litorale]|jgi:AcrR family transcriptional regulator|uniref:TetR/AcrR family transcriptional regulator n=1 Tax=Mycolicibacterium litorale TaxID=758802 RepID=UPI0034978EE9
MARESPSAAVAGRLTERHRALRAELIREEIVDAALTEFSERGYHDTSIAHIGKRLGSAPSMIYNYFTNKREILDVAVNEALTAAGTAVAQLTGEPPQSAEEFRSLANELGNAAVDILTRDHRTGRMLVMIATSNDPELRERWTGFHDLARGMIERFIVTGGDAGFLRPEIDPHQTARAILALPMGVLANDMSYRPTADEAHALVRAIVAMVADGIYDDPAS